MKNLGLSCILFFLSLGAKAQVNFSLSTDSHIVYMDQQNGETEFDGVTDITTSLSSLSISWKIIETDMPAEWTYIVCDNFDCYLDEDLQDATVLRKSADIAADEPGLIKGAVYPKGHSGVGSFKVVLMQNADSTLTDTITFIFDANTSTVGPVFSSLQLYPNPAGNTLYLTLPNGPNTSMQVSIYNTVGQKQNSFETTHFTRHVSIDIGALNAGSYLMEATTPKGEILIQYFVKRGLY